MVSVAQAVVPTSPRDMITGCAYTRHLANAQPFYTCYLTLMKPLLPSPFFFKKKLFSCSRPYCSMRGLVP